MNRSQKIKNKQFYKYWKKESADWRGRATHGHHNFRLLCNLSNKTGIPIYTIIDRISADGDYSLHDIEKVEKKVGAKISPIEFNALMRITGFEYNAVAEIYYCNEERAKRIQNVCDATRECINSQVAMTLSDKIKVRQKTYYHNQSEKYARKRDKLALDLDITAAKTEPANGERISNINGKIQKFLLIIGIALFVFLIYSAIRINLGNYMKTDSDTISFWNALIGACIPGMVTIVTTSWLIHHEYKVDYHRERMESLPVFSMVHVVRKEKLIDQDGKWDISKSGSERFYNTSYIDNLQNKDVIIYKFINKGCGMAFAVQHDKGDEVFVFGDVAQEEEYYIALKDYDSLKYTISYIDIYGNKYIQRFLVKKENGRYQISSYPPELVLRTQLIRYQQ